MKTVKGMVQVDGRTYRIVRLSHGAYQAIRILDDVSAGRFYTGVALVVVAEGVAEEELREIALTAMHDAKTSWVGY